MKQQVNDFLNTVISAEKCTGCQACKNVCPRRAIDMVEDSEGFLLPVKNSNCTDCKLCLKTCPVMNDVKKSKVLNESKVYLLRHKDEDVVNLSSSGGAFTAIVQEYDSEDCVVFGAEYENDFKVSHNYVQCIKELDKLRKSKYVQSDVKDTYAEVKDFLIAGKKVIYSGTPCQIAGLRNYLGRDYHNLLCVDLICHGVPSYKVFRKYLEFIERKYNSKVKRVTFRERKKEGKNWNSKNISILFGNGRSIVQSSTQNDYLKGYHNKLFYRRSCENCKFASIERNSDITIADCWGIEKVFKDIDVHKGYSMVVVNTEKGERIFEEVKKHQDVKQLSLNFAISSNAQFSHPTEFHKNRKVFYDNLDKMQFDKLVNKCLRRDLIKARIRKVIPKSFNEMAKRFLRRK